MAVGPKAIQKKGSKKGWGGRSLTLRAEGVGLKKRPGHEAARHAGHCLDVRRPVEDTPLDPATQKNMLTFTFTL